MLLSEVLGGLGLRVDVLSLNLASGAEMVTLTAAGNCHGLGRRAARLVGRGGGGCIDDGGIYVAGSTETTFGGVQGRRSVVVSEMAAQSHRVHVVASTTEPVVEVHTVRHHERFRMVEVRCWHDTVEERLMSQHPPNIASPPRGYLRDRLHELLERHHRYDN